MGMVENSHSISPLLPWQGGVIRSVSVSPSLKQGQVQVPQDWAAGGFAWGFVCFVLKCWLGQSPNMAQFLCLHAPEVARGYPTSHGTKV